MKYDKSSSASSGFSGGSSSGSNIVGWLIPGHWDHAAFFDKDKYGHGTNYFLFSASNETEEHKNNPGVLGRVGYDAYKDYWNIATEVAVDRVTAASHGQAANAVLYSRQFIMREFNFFTTRANNKIFYCSKTVYRGWLSQGYELEPHKDSYTGLPWMPVLKFWRWNYKWVWFVKVWYPEFKWVIVKDAFVTPTDLDEDNNTYRYQLYQ